MVQLLEIVAKQEFDFLTSLPLARITLCRLRKEYPRMDARCILSKFPGLRKKTLGCDMDTSIELVMLLPGKEF